MLFFEIKHVDGQPILKGQPIVQFYLVIVFPYME